MTDRTETIKISGGVEYAKVAARCVKWHETNEQCSCETSCEFKNDYVVFRATVTTQKGKFTGHSLGKPNRAKEFEKLETIAVGRALAFAGFLASGDIATYEEMADIVTANQLNSLKLKYAKLHETELAPLDRPAKLQKFSSWCCSVIGENVDYSDPQAWSTGWFEKCWQELIGPDADVPFGG
jgi:hypothetical protein